jgi:hypothetical protein
MPSKTTKKLKPQRIQSIGRMKFSPEIYPETTTTDAEKALWVGTSGSRARMTPIKVISPTMKGVKIIAR